MKFTHTYIIAKMISHLIAPYSFTFSISLFVWSFKKYLFHILCLFYHVKFLGMYCYSLLCLQTLNSWWFSTLLIARMETAQNIKLELSRFKVNFSYPLLSKFCMKTMSPYIYIFSYKCDKIRDLVFKRFSFKYINVFWRAKQCY